MKKESWTCDICGNPTKEDSVHTALLSIGKAKSTRHEFHVCSTCYTETPKGVFQKAFNLLFRASRTGK